MYDISASTFYQPFLNPLWLFWIITTTIIIFPGFGIITSSNWIPKSINSIYCYGKFISQQKQNKIQRFINIPKRWFVHFYWFASLFNTIHLIIVYRAYVEHKSPPKQIINLLDFLAPSRVISVDTMAIFLSIILLFIQTLRRLYECLFVSVYSSSTINVVHYLIGFAFYFSITETLLSEAPGFSHSDLISFDAQFQFNVKLNHVIGVVLFLLATLMHNRSHVALANLRKNNKGKVITTSHVIPMGFWFEYVTCPHFLAEIIIYFSIFIVLGFKHFGWFWVLCFVVSNQVLTAVLNHKWYEKKFGKLYPKKRKAIFPFVL